MKKKVVLSVSIIFLLVALLFGGAGLILSETSKDIAAAEGNKPTEEEKKNVLINIEKKGFPIEITYNNLLLDSGSIIRGYQFRLDTNLMTTGLTDAIAMEKLNEYEKSFDKIEELFGETSALVKRDDFLIEVILEHYQSYTDMYVAYGITGYEKNEPREKTGGFLFNKIVQKDKVIFSRLKEESKISEAIGIIKSEVKRDESDIKYIYNYGTKYSKNFISSNAQEIYSSRLGITVHSFIFSEDELQSEIEIVQTAPNTLVWYGFVLVVSIIAAGIILTIAIKNNKQKK